MNDKPITMVNQELLFWSVTVVVELVILAALTQWFLFLLCIIPMVYWPIQDALKWPVPKEPSPPPADREKVPQTTLPLLFLAIFLSCLS